MRAFWSVFIVALGLSGGIYSSSEAASLRVSPVILDLRAPAAAGSVRLWNDGDEPVNVQIRVYRWIQVEGEEQLVPTTDVVASPPITTLSPGGENLVRIVRTATEQVEGEESYRLLVDELPDPGIRRTVTVELLVRHSLPVFFSDPQANNPRPIWSLTRSGGDFLLTVHNSGPRRLKVSNLSLVGEAGELGSRGGLVGYALGNSSTTWRIPVAREASPGSLVTLSAEGEAGPITATVRYQGN